MRHSVETVIVGGGVIGLAVAYELLQRGRSVRVIERDELDELGADPDAHLFLEPAVGYALSGDAEGDAFVAPTDRRGSHGYLPTEPDLHTERPAREFAALAARAAPDVEVRIPAPGVPRSRSSGRGGAGGLVNETPAAVSRGEDLGLLGRELLFGEKALIFEGGQALEPGDYINS